MGVPLLFGDDMARKKQTVERMSWLKYQQILQVERDRWVKGYGNQRSRRLSFSKRTNAQRVNGTHLDDVLLEDIEKKLVTYQAKNPIARFFIRLFTNIEKKRALYHYQMTLNALDNLLASNIAPINHAELQKSFLQLNQHARKLSWFSRASKLQKRLRRQLKRNELEPFTPMTPFDSPTASTTSSTTTEILSQLKSADALATDQPTPLSSTMTEASTSTPLQSIPAVADETKVKEFNQALEQNKANFEQMIDKEKIVLKAFVHECHQRYPNNAEQVSIETQSALAKASKELKKSYHQLSLRYHPDKVTDTSMKGLAEKTFKEITILYTNGLSALGNIVTEQIKPEFACLYKQTEELKAGVAALQKRLQQIAIDMDELSKGFKSIIEINDRFMEEIKKLAESGRKVEQMQKENLDGFRKIRQSYRTMFTDLDVLKAQVDILNQERDADFCHQASNHSIG